MKRALLYILLASFILPPFVLGVGLARAQVVGPAKAIDLKVTAPPPTLTCIDWGVVPPTFHINWGMCAANVAWIIRAVVGWFTEQAGVLLNFVVQELVFRMGAMTGVLEAVTITWSVMRDIANVILVFLVIFVGIAVIIRATSYNSKQLLYRIIIAALLVNFSLYFAKVVIDVTNLFAAQTYIMILKEGLADKPTVPPAAPFDPGACATSQIGPANYDTDCFKIGLSGAFMNVMKINTLFSDATANNNTQADAIGWNIFYIMVMGTVLLAVLCFIFLAASILFITRFVTLVYLMIVSPIAFVGLVTGRFSYGKEWWNQLLNNALFAPVFFLLLWVSMVVIKRMTATYWPAGGTYSALALSATSGFTILIVFTVSAGLLIGSLIAAKKLGVAGTNAAISFAGGVMFGAPAALWRNTGGRHYDRLANDEGMQNRAAGFKTDKYGKKMYNYDKDGKVIGGPIKEESKYKVFAAQKQLQTAQRLAKSSGDMRQGIKKLPLGMGKAGSAWFEKNVGTLGEGHKGGYAAMKKDYVKGQQEFAESLGVDRPELERLTKEQQGSTEIVVDPVTGQQTVVRTKGLIQRTDEKRTEARGAQRRYQEEHKELQQARRALRAGTGDQKEVDRLELRVARREAVARGRSTQLNAMENEGIIMQDQMLRTNRAYGYADTLEHSANTPLITDNFGQGYSIPGIAGSQGILVSSNSEQLAAANAIRTKFKNQQKYRGLTEAFKEMEAAGVIAPGTTAPGGGGPTGGGGGYSGGGGGTGGTGSGGGGSTAQPYRRPTGPRPNAGGTGQTAPNASTTPTSTSQPASAQGNTPPAQPATSAPQPTTPAPQPQTQSQQPQTTPASTPAPQPQTQQPAQPTQPQPQAQARPGFTPIPRPQPQPRPESFRQFNTSDVIPPAPQQARPESPAEVKNAYGAYLGEQNRYRREAQTPTPTPTQPQPVQQPRAVQEQLQQRATPTAVGNAPLASITSPANVATDKPPTPAEAAVPAWQEARVAPVQQPPQQQSTTAKPKEWKYNPTMTWDENIAAARASGIEDGAEGLVGRTVAQARQQYETNKELDAGVVDDLLRNQWTSPDQRRQTQAWYNSLSEERKRGYRDQLVKELEDREKTAGINAAAREKYNTLFPTEGSRRAHEALQKVFYNGTEQQQLMWRSPSNLTHDQKVSILEGGGDFGGTLMVEGMEVGSQRPVSFKDRAELMAHIADAQKGGRRIYNIDDLVGRAQASFMKKIEDEAAATVTQNNAAGNASDTKKNVS